MQAVRNKRRQQRQTTLTGKYSWRLDEMYAIMDLIQEPYEKLHEYFPKNGAAEPPRRLVG